ncbi:hypothetical protein AKJ16_DCAP10089 [Drosera capensis]
MWVCVDRISVVWVLGCGCGYGRAAGGFVHLLRSDNCLSHVPDCLQQRTVAKWHTPPSGRLKVNVDAALGRSDLLSLCNAPGFPVQYLLNTWRYRRSKVSFEARRQEYKGFKYQKHRI